MNKYISPYTPSKTEIDRRYTNIRKAMQLAGLDYLIVSGSEYTGFEGAVRYMCGFHILHRYALPSVTSYLCTLFKFIL